MKFEEGFAAPLHRPGARRRGWIATFARLSLTGIVLRLTTPPGQRHRQLERMTDADSQQATTDAQGRFAAGLRPGPLHDRVLQRQGKVEVRRRDSATGGPLRLIINGFTAILSGTVVGLPRSRAAGPRHGHGGSRDGEPLGARLRSRCPASHRGRPSWSHGHRERDDAGGSRAPASRATTLAAGSDQHDRCAVHDDLCPTGTVRGGGAPAPDLAVSFLSPEERDASSSTDREGTYEVRLAPGPYRVAVSGQSIDYETAYVAVDSGSFDIDVTGGTLRGRAVDAGSGMPVAGVEVSLWREGGDNSPVTSLDTSAQGTFEAPLVREGRYRVVTARKGFARPCGVEVSRGETTEVVLSFSRRRRSVKVTTRGRASALGDRRRARPRQAAGRQPARRDDNDGPSSSPRRRHVLLPLRERWHHHGADHRAVQRPLRFGLYAGAAWSSIRPAMRGRTAPAQPDREHVRAAQRHR